MSTKKHYIIINFLFIDLLRRQEKHWFAILPIDAFIGWFLYVPGLGIEPTTLVDRVDALTNWVTWPG